MYYARAPKHFLLPRLFPISTWGSWLEPWVDVKGWCSNHAVPTLKALAGEVQESSSMVNVEIYWQRQLLILIHIFICLHLLCFPSLPFFLPALLGWFIASIFPHITYMSHIASFPSVVLRSSLCLLFTRSTSPTVSLLSLVYPYPFLISNLVDYVPYFYCFLS